MRSTTFRTRILLIVLGAAVVPLALVGLWLSGSAQRSGEDLLRGRLNLAVEETVSEIATRWVTRRSSLLFLTEEPSALRALASGPTSGPPTALVRRFRELGAGVERAVIRDADGVEVWTLESDVPSGGASPDEFPAPTATVGFDIRDRVSGRFLGSIDMAMRAEVFLPVGGIPGAAGMVVALFDTTGVPLTAVPVDPTVLASEVFTWGGDEWLAVRRELDDPPLRVVVAAPATPFAEPFTRASRRGVWVLLLAALVAIGATALLTGRLTRSLTRLSEAAVAVTHGELGRRVDVRGEDEVGKVAGAFNAMTESLERTLARLSTRESLAAVGQFAASLAHEVRNPLTAIRLDLQRVEEALPTDFRFREEHRRALAEIERLDETVSAALEGARAGSAPATRIDVRDPIRAAARAAAPFFEQSGATIHLELGDQARMVDGDGGALEQLFLNLFRNAAEAMSAGGEAMVTNVDGEDRLIIDVRDTGPGIHPDLRERVLEPLFTTRPEGTGLGLTVARRIAVAHGGTLELRDAEGGGLLVRIEIPLQSGVAIGSGALSRSDGPM